MPEAELIDQILPLERNAGIPDKTRVTLLDKQVNSTGRITRLL
jgi:hypothetical protein